MAIHSPNKVNFLKHLFIKSENAINQDETVNYDNTKILEYYASLAKNHPDIILVFSTDGEVVSQNRSSINKLLGYSPRVKLKYKDLITNPTYAVLETAFHRALSGKSEKYEVDVKRKDNKVIFLLITFIPITVENEIEGVYLLIEDISEQKILKQQLEINAKHLNHAQQIAEVGSWEYVINDDSLYCSDYFYDIFGIDKKEKVSMDKPFEFVHPEDYEKAYDKVKQAYEGESFFNEFRIYHGKTNELKYIQVQADVIWKNNRPYKLVGVVKDNTNQKKLENELININDNLKHIFDNIFTGVWLKDYKTGKPSYLSKGLEEIMQVPLEDIYNNPLTWEEMILPEHHSEVMNRQKLLEKGESIKHQYRIQAGDGTTKWVFDQTIPWFNDDGELEKLFGVMVDISPEVEMQERLKYNALNDSLTGLPNRQSFLEKLDSICKGNNDVALLYIDLDRFNVTNDSLGHPIGDAVLKGVTNRLITNLSKKGYIARLGSNDFVVLLENFTDRKEISSIVESTLRHIEVPMTIKDYELHITASIGISIFPEDGDDRLTLIENAHSALYFAKEHGKNNYQFYSNLSNVSTYKKYTLEKDIRKAIVNEEFELYYQPQVEPFSGVIKGAEALIRWNHNEWGLVSPGEFIPLAEESHLIHHISDWVIRKVVMQLREWRDKGYTLRPISINISPMRFLKNGLVELVKEQLELFQIEAKYLEFEITESSLLNSEKQVLSTLEKLGGLGIKIVIDDFGTGFASLDYVRKFDVAKIKIDQIFMQDIETNHKNAAIVSSVLHLSKGLNVEIVAEGVEDIEQFEFLKQKECDLIQGYLFSKPVPTKTLEEMLKTGYLKPQKIKKKTKVDKERRKYYRFKFPYCVLGEMTITYVGKKKVQLGSTYMLMEDISLGGIKLISSLKLPVETDMKFNFQFKLIKEIFNVEGSLQWKEEAKGGIYHYGVKMDINEREEARLARIINKLSVLRNLNHEIPDTDFIYEDPIIYLKKNIL